MARTIEAYKADYLKGLLGAQGKNDGTYYLGHSRCRVSPKRSILKSVGVSTGSSMVLARFFGMQQPQQQAESFGVHGKLERSR